MNLFLKFSLNIHYFLPKMFNFDDKNYFENWGKLHKSLSFCFPIPSCYFHAFSPTIKHALSPGEVFVRKLGTNRAHFKLQWLCLGWTVFQDLNRFRTKNQLFKMIWKELVHHVFPQGICIFDPCYCFCFVFSTFFHEALNFPI